MTTTKCENCGCEIECETTFSLPMYCDLCDDWFAYTTEEEST